MLGKKLLMSLKQATNITSTKNPLSSLNNAVGEAEQNPSYLSANLTEDSAAQLLKR